MAMENEPKSAPAGKSVAMKPDEGPAEMPSPSAAPRAIAGSPPTDSTKLPQPDKEDLADAVKQIRGRYKADFAAAKTPEEKVVLAKKLSTLAREGDDEEPAPRFALFKATIGLATGGGDFLLALAPGASWARFSPSTCRQPSGKC